MSCSLTYVHEARGTQEQARHLFARGIHDAEIKVRVSQPGFFLWVKGSDHPRARFQLLALGPVFGRNDTGFTGARISSGITDLVPSIWHIPQVKNASSQSMKTRRFWAFPQSAFIYICKYRSMCCTNAAHSFLSRAARYFLIISTLEQA